ncbi:MAG: rRNA methyltransferase [Streptomycetales bacterium]
MAYRYVTSRDDYRDFASGSVLHSAPGYPAYPVRLSSELFLRALSHLPDRLAGLWDPCCGSGILITTVGLLHRERLRYILATDIDPEAAALAVRNVALLTGTGLTARADKLRERQNEFDKAVHREAAEAAIRLAQRLAASGGDLPASVATADVFDPASLAAVVPTPPPDLVLIDLPYGKQTTWAGSPPLDTEPTYAAMRALAAVLPDHAVIALTVHGRKVPTAPGIQALERFRVGTRAGLVARAAQIRECE